MATLERATADVDALDGTPPYAALAAAWAVVAGVVHLLLVREHAETSWVFGGFFAAVGGGQMLLAAGLLRPRPPGLVAAAVVAQLGVIGLYVASRTVDLWFMPVHHAGEHVEHLPVVNGVGNGVPVHDGSRMEPVGALDLLCLGAELAVVVLLTVTLPERHRRVVTGVMLWLGLGLVLLRGIVGPG